MFRNTSDGPSNAVRYTLIAVVTLTLMIGLSGIPMLAPIQEASAANVTTFEDFEDGTSNITSATAQSDYVIVGDYSGEVSPSAPREQSQFDNVTGDTLQIKAEYGGDPGNEHSIVKWYDKDTTVTAGGFHTTASGEYIEARFLTEYNTSVAAEPGVTYTFFIDFQGDLDTFDAYIYTDGSLAWNKSGLKTASSGTSTVPDWGSIEVDGEGSVSYYIDSYKMNLERAEVPRPTITGQVTDDETGDPIANANVTVTNSSTGTEVVNTTTDGSGFYSVEVENGTYDVTADATDYFADTATVTIEGTSVVQDFQLTPRSAALVLSHRTYLEHGQQTPYTVTYQNITNGTVTDTTDVTDAATVTSANVDVVTVNSNEQTLVATQNTSVNERTYIEATYTQDGETYTTRRNITVANQTTANLEILPGTAVRSSAVLLDTTIQALIVATFIGIIGARVATAFAGLGMMQMTIVAGWFVGYVSVGMAMVSLFTALFIGLNMAANIDYTVRR